MLLLIQHTLSTQPGPPLFSYFTTALLLTVTMLLSLGLTLYFMGRHAQSIRKLLLMNEALRRSLLDTGTVGFMCGESYARELGHAYKASVYLSPQALAKEHSCIKTCGLMQVRVIFEKHVPAEDASIVEVLTNPVREELPLTSRTWIEECSPAKVLADAEEDTEEDMYL